MISRQLVSSPFFTHTLCGHSVHLLGSSLGLWYSLRPRLITQMQDTKPILPNLDVFSLQHAPPQFYSSDPLVSHHTSAPTLHSYSFKYIHNYPAKLLAQRRISIAQPSCSPNRPPPLSIYPLRPHLLPSALLFYPLHPFRPKTFSLLFTPQPTLLPISSFPPPFINAAPLLTIIRAASCPSYHTHQEKSPHAFFAAVMERFPQPN